MISKIWSCTENSGLNKIVTKCFQRNLQNIKTRSAYTNDNLYFREWIVEGYNTCTGYRQSYYKNNPIKESRYKIDFKT